MAGRVAADLVYLHQLTVGREPIAEVAELHAATQLAFELRPQWHVTVAFERLGLFGEFTQGNPR